ncbi:MAG: FeoB-associated Cys-rich membrane protein [Bifidobacteriaceae bacterium]|jgi:hypothetical protein|nr:FeoB-associated Cys-rich membrane protein [Bifidobacteriaceae bacterium]
MGQGTSLLGTLLVGTLVLALVVGVVVKLVRDKQAGRRSCAAGSCGGCPSNADCGVPADSRPTAHRACQTPPPGRTALGFPQVKPSSGPPD